MVKSVLFSLIKLSKVVIYNYNQKDRLEIGTKEIDIYIDNYFYQKYNLIQGIGEIAYIDKDADKKDLTPYNFGQEIFFPIKENLNEIENEKDINKLVEEDKPLEKEFEILTEIGLRKVRVVQNSLEENKIQGNLFKTNVTRITDYHIYIIHNQLNLPKQFQ